MYIRPYTIIHVAHLVYDVNKILKLDMDCKQSGPKPSWRIVLVVWLLLQLSSD